MYEKLSVFTTNIKKNVSLQDNIQSLFAMKKFYAALLLPMITIYVSAFSQMQIEGRYAYEHSWSYDTDTARLDVYETGFINFYEDGTALDEAQHVFVITHSDGSKDTSDIRYASPSRWRADDEHLYYFGRQAMYDLGFADNIYFGDKLLGYYYFDVIPNTNVFWLKLHIWININDTSNTSYRFLPQKGFEKEIVRHIRKSIGHETVFHYSIPSKNSKKTLILSYTHPDGRTETWEFRRLHHARKRCFNPLEAEFFVGGSFVPAQYDIKDIDLLEPLDANL